MSTALYGTETWSTAVTEKKRLNVDEMSEDYVWSNVYRLSEK